MNRLEQLAAAHRRVLLTEQLLAAGLTSNDVQRLRRHSELIRIVRGVYAVPPFDESFDRLSVRAVSRRFQPCAVSCEPGLLVHGCDIPLPVEVHVTTHISHVVVSTPGVHAHATRRMLEIVVVDGIATLPAPLCLLGAWRDLPDRNDRRAIVCAALVQGVTTSAGVRIADPSGRRIPRAAELLQTCDYVDAGCESPAEIAYLLEVELAFRLPPPTGRQRWITLPDGRRRRVDVLYEPERLIIEIDGAHHRLDEAVRALDAVHDAALARLGYRVRRFTWADITNRPGWVAAEIRAELAARVA